MKTATIKATYTELFAGDGTKLFSLQAADMNGKPAFIYSMTTGSPEEWENQYGWIPVSLTDDAKAVIRTKDPARAEDIINKTEFVKAIAVDWDTPANNTSVIWDKGWMNSKPPKTKQWIIGGAIALAALALLNKK